MKLPKFLTINPDFKKAVDAYPEKDKIEVCHFHALNAHWVNFGDEHYYDPTWAECRYARKVSDPARAQKNRLSKLENLSLRAENNRRVCHEIIEQAERVGRA